MTGIPFIKEFDFKYGAPARLSPLVRRVIAENPGPFTFTGSGTYLVGEEAGPIAIIDPGPNLESHLDALVRSIGDARVQCILVTHTHSDHCGGARALASRIGAPILGAGPHPVADKALDAPALDEGADYKFRPDQLLLDGAMIAGAGWTIEAVATPGHLSNHLCFGLKQEKALFTGDHMMGWATTVIAPPDGDMQAYFSSLDKLLVRDDAVYYPTHGAPIAKPKAFVRAVRAHRRIRDGQIIEQLKKGRSKIAEIVPEMYRDIDARLHKAAALNVYAHLIRLVKIGSVLSDGPAEMNSSYSVAATPPPNHG